MAAAFLDHTRFEGGTGGAADIDAGDGTAGAAGKTSFRIAGENEARAGDSAP